MTKPVERRASELRALAARMLQVATDIEGEELSNVLVKRRNSPLRESWDAADAELMITKASEIYRARRRRKRFFATDLFGEPAWDLLLDLFISRLKKKRISVTSACSAADVPSTTALRWLGVLEEAHLIERFDSETDQRVTWVQLTDYGSQIMFEFFEDMNVQSPQFPPSHDQYVIQDSNSK